MPTTDRYLRDLENQFGDHGLLRFTLIDLGIDSTGEFGEVSSSPANRDGNDCLQSLCTVILVCVIYLDAAEV